MVCPVSPLLKIGEIARATGVAVSTLRYYETLGLIQPVERGDNGYRYYEPSQIDRIHFIKKAQTLRFSLDEIRQILGVRDQGTVVCPMVQALLARKLEQLTLEIEQMQTFRQELQAYSDRWSQAPLPSSGDRQVCPLIETVALTERAG